MIPVARNWTRLVPRWGWALALLLGTPVVVQAQERDTVAVVPTEWVGVWPDAARELLTRKLNEGLAQAQLEVKPESNVSCADPGCYRETAQTVGASFLVKARVEIQGRSYDIELELVNGRNGQPGGTHRQRCAICGLAEVGERMSLAASALAARIQSLAQTPSRIVILSHPEGAQVAIDGTPQGQSPVEVSLAAGTHTLRLSRSGHRELTREVTVVPGVDHAVELDLVRVPSAFPYKVAGWASAATGVAVFVTGVVLMTRHGDELSCAESEKDRQGDCPYVLSTSYLGAGLMTAGAALGTLGGFWIYLGSHTLGGGTESAAMAAGYRGAF